MNKGRLVGAIVCLVLAGLLLVLSYVLPEGKVVFMMGDRNMPIIPVIVLAGLGVWLASTVWRRQDL
jgi:hypothetical protein